MNRTPALALVALLAFTGCTAPTPEATTPPISEPSAPAVTPTADPIVVTEPEPLLDASCSEITPGAVYSHLSTTALEEADPRELVEGEYAYGIPYGYPLAQLQSTQCLWRNDEPKYNKNGAANEYTSLSFTALPNGEDAWAEYKNVYGTTKGFVGASCNGAEQPNARCRYDGLLENGTWLEVTFEGMKNFGSDAKNLAKFKEVVAQASSVLESASTGVAWAAPADTRQIATGCPSVITPEDVATAVGGKATDVKFNSDGIGGTSISNEARRLLGANECRWFTKLAPSEYGTPYRVLAGGEWAWLSARESTAQFLAAEELPLDGLAEGDSAWIRDDGYILTADLIVGRNWIAIDTYNDSFASKTKSKAALSKLAQLALDRVYGN